MSMATSGAVSEQSVPLAAAEAPAAKKSKARPYLILGAIVAVGLGVTAVVSWLSRGKE